MSKSRQFYEQDYLIKSLELSNQELGLTAYLKAEAKFLSDYVKEGSTLLDVGCGTGRSLDLLLDKVSKAYGIDFSNLMLNEARKALGQNPKVKLIKADAKSIPYEDNKFDYVISTFNTYGNFENPDKCLDEMLRVAKPEGEVILGVYSQAALETQLRTYKRIGLNIEFFNQEAVYTKEGLVSRRFTKEKLEEIAKQHGAQIDVVELTPISYIAILQKVKF